MFGSLSTARSSISARLGTPTSPSPSLAHGLLAQGFVDSPADVPGGLGGFGAAAGAAARTSRSLTPSLSFDTATTPDANEWSMEGSSPREMLEVLPKHRPNPLDLHDTHSEVARDAPLSNDSGGFTQCRDLTPVRSNLSSEFEHLRRAVQQNLLERPLDRTLESDDDELDGTPGMVSWPHTIAPASALAAIRSSKQVIVVDTRPLDDFCDAHLPRSAHIAIPRPIYNRMCEPYRNSSPVGTSWSSLAPFVSSSSGRRRWDAVDLQEHVEVIIVGGECVESTNTLAVILSQAVPKGQVNVLHGEWDATVELAYSEGMVVNGESSDSDDQRTPVPRVQVAPESPLPSAPAPSQTSGVTLSPMGRNLPALSLNFTNREPGNKLGNTAKLSINVNPTSVPLPTKALSSRSRPRPGGLTIDVGDSNRLSPSTPHDHAPRSALTPRGSLHSARISSTTEEEPGASLLQPGRLQVSTILPSFLYLGPEIATRADVETLLAMGIRRVLNVAVELDDDETLGLRTSFDRYYRIPMKDSVEEAGVGRGIREACDILGESVVRCEV